MESPLIVSAQNRYVQMLSATFVKLELANISAIHWLLVEVAGVVFYYVTAQSNYP